MAKIVMVGGGSVNWSPRLINDLLLTPRLADSEYVIYDKNTAAAERMAAFGNLLARQRGLAAAFHAAGEDDAEAAFTGAGYVIVTISTGDLDAMEHDLRIPEDYRIYQTVGDTVGPGGWARSLRNIPVFVRLAHRIERYAPKAVVLNYTNPMATLTKVFCRTSGLRTVGLCHGLFEVYDALKQIFGLDSENDIKVRFGGTNHFFWITELRIRGEDGYALLREKMAGRPFGALLAGDVEDVAGFHSNKLLCSELFDTFGLLPYVGDRHTCEFFPHLLTGDEARLAKYGLVRTTIDHRRQYRAERLSKLEAMLDGRTRMTEKRSRESAADIIAAFEGGGDFIDVVNLPNEGQIPNLPLGSIVETLGVVNAVGFTPLVAGKLPEPILDLVLPHVRNQDLIVEAALTGDRDMALLALYNDPLCAHLTYPERKELGLRLLEANERYMPESENLLRSNATPL